MEWKISNFVHALLICNLKLEAISSPLDPRADRIDVTVPEIPFDPEDIILKLEHFKHRPYTTVRSRKMIKKIIDR